MLDRRAGQHAALAGLLENDLVTTEQRILSLAVEFDDLLESASSTTSDDEHDPEGATIGFERAQASALLNQARAHLDDIKAAMARLRTGSYGRCLRCGSDIVLARLEARPSAALCLSCAAESRRGAP